MKTIQKIDMYITESFIGKKEFKKIVDNIIDQFDERKQARFWDKWDEAVDGGGDLYIEDILWRLYTPSYGGKKMWEKFVKEWTAMGLKI